MGDRSLPRARDAGARRHRRDDLSKRPGRTPDASRRLGVREGRGWPATSLARRGMARSPGSRGPRDFGDPSRVEFLLNESSGAMWQFRRNRAITRRIDRIGMRTSAGVPFLVPEIVLLFKAKAFGAKDARDFDLIRPRLRAEPRRWLKHALETCHPGHPWIARL